MTEPSRLRSRWLLAALAVFAFAASYYVQAQWFPHLSKNNDEAVYLMQAQMLREGRVTLPPDFASESLRPWMSGPVDDRLIMVFPPAWPAALAAGLALFGSTRVIVALVAASLVPLTYAVSRELFHDRDLALGAATLTTVSPLALVLAGTSLSYIFGFALGLAIAACTLRACQHSPRWLLGAGAAAGVMVGTRPLDAALTVLIFGVVLLRAWRGDLRRVTRGLALGFAGAALPLVLVFWYNARVTGHPLRFPIEAAGGHNAFGFGERFIAPGTPVTNVSLYDQLRATAQNLLWYPLWVFGGVVAVPLALWGAIALWRHSRFATIALGAITVLFPAAYVFYWGTLLVAVGRREFGPHYYVPLLLPASMAVAAGLRELYRRSRPLLGGALVLMFAVTALYDLPFKHDFAADHNRLVEPEIEAMKEVPPGSLVILPRSGDGAWMLHPRGYFRNPTSLDAPVLFAADTGAGNFALGDRFADRSLYRLLPTIPEGGRADRPTAKVKKLEILSGSAVTISMKFDNSTGDPLVTTYVGRPGRLTRCVIDEASSKGKRYDLQWRLDAQGAELRGATCIRSVGPQALQETDFGQMVVGFSAGSTDEWFGVHRFEYLLSTRVVGPRVELMVPGEERRVYPTALDDRPAVFIGQVDHVLSLEASSQPN